MSDVGSRVRMCGASVRSGILLRVIDHCMLVGAWAGTAVWVLRLCFALARADLSGSVRVSSFKFQVSSANGNDSGLSAIVLTPTECGAAGAAKTGVKISNCGGRIRAAKVNSWLMAEWIVAGRPPRADPRQVSSGEWLMGGPEAAAAAPQNAEAEERETEGCTREALRDASNVHRKTCVYLTVRYQRHILCQTSPTCRLTAKESVRLRTRLAHTGFPIIHIPRNSFRPSPRAS